MTAFKEICAFQEMFISLVKRDLRGRYKGSLLGFMWSFLNPLAMMCIYAIVFPVVFGVKEKNYFMFIFVTLMPWQYFNNAVIIGTNSIIANGNLVKKIYFPRIILPLATSISNLCTYFITCAIQFAALILTGIGLNSSIIYFPLVIFVELLFVTAMCILVSALTVFFRDLEHIMTIFFQALFFVTPVLYGVKTIPRNISFILNLNPITPIILAYRDILYYGKTPNLLAIFAVMIFSVVLLSLSIFVFDKLQRGFAEEL